MSILLAALPYLEEIRSAVREFSAYLKDASPVVLMVIGAVMFLLAGVAKGIIKLIGAGLFIYGLLAALHFI
jgi:hypothetical protein